MPLLLEFLIDLINRLNLHYITKMFLFLLYIFDEQRYNAKFQCRNLHLRSIMVIFVFPDKYNALHLQSPRQDWISKCRLTIN